MNNMNRGRQLIDHLGQAARATGNFVGPVDDAIQRGARYVLGERYDDAAKRHYQSTFGRGLAEVMHRDRRELPNNWEKPVYLVGTRAAQAGGLTAAGYGLHQLTQAMAQYGSPADYPEPNQLSL